MCGRYKQTGALAELQALFALKFDGIFQPRGTVTPGMTAPVITQDRGLSFMIWGFVPHWSKENTGSKIINARAETLAEKPSFRDSFKQRRCLIPANGFVEWDINSKPKRAYDIEIANKAPFAFAGIYDLWQDEQTAKTLESFAIVTLAAREPVARIHDRMPMILAESESMAAWLDKGQMLPSAAVLDMSMATAPDKRRTAPDTRQMSLF